MLFSRCAALVVAAMAASASLQAPVVNAAVSALGDATCDSYVLASSRAASIGAIEDTSCLSDKTGVGCFANACRFCRHETTEQSKFFVHCDAAQRKREQQTQETAVLCAEAVSLGDRNAGLSAFYDAGCPIGSGGLGCQANKCRLCKTRQTPQSASYLSCPVTATGATSATGTSPPATCEDAVRASRLTSVQFVTQSRCNTATPQLDGCVPRTTCQLCRVAKNEANQRLISCKVLRDTLKIEALATNGGGHESETAMAEVDEMTEETEEDTAALAFNAAMAHDDNKHDGSYAWLAAGGIAAGTLAVVVAVLAIRKSRQRQRLDAMATPRTPIDASLMSVHTCIATL